jgi:hypothetical protein
LTRRYENVTIPSDWRKNHEYDERFPEPDRHYAHYDYHSTSDDAGDFALKIGRQD